MADPRNDAKSKLEELDPDTVHELLHIYSTRQQDREEDGGGPSRRRRGAEAELGRACLTVAQAAQARKALGDKTGIKAGMCLDPFIEQVHGELGATKVAA